jgi:hypothetical protein
MYGPGGPGYGSGLGFNGFGMNDPWMLFEQYKQEQAIQAASGLEKAPGPEKAPGTKGGSNATKPANSTAPANKTAPVAGT